MKIVPYFTSKYKNAFDMFRYVKHDVKITHHVTGATVFEMQGAEVPEDWSPNARNVLVSKYFRKAGVPLQTIAKPQDGCPEWLLPMAAAPGTEMVSENSVKQVIHRIVGHWTYVGYNNGYFDPSEDDMATAMAGSRMDNASLIRSLCEANAKNYYNEMVYIILNQMGAPNSPQWFNTGLWWAYGIEGPAQGHYYVDAPANTNEFRELAQAQYVDDLENKPSELRYDPEDHIDATRRTLDHYTRTSTNAYERVQAHACFILELNDTMLGSNGIFSWLEREARIFKYGSGSGVNPSSLRGAGEKLSGGGSSSGMMSWLKIADMSAGAIKSGGTTRRAAKMVAVDLDHPDILDFIDCKVESELKVASMHAGSKHLTRHCNAIMKATHSAIRLHQSAFQTNDVAGRVGVARSDAKVKELMQAAAKDGLPHNYIDRAISMSAHGHTEWVGSEMDLEYEGEAYATVPFQNANNSVRIPTEFYERVDADAKWQLTARTDGSITHVMTARELEEKIAFAAWFCADPGVQFDTTINDWNVTPEDGRIRASNPCSEHLRPDNSACNLASQRLMKFVYTTIEGAQFHTEAFIHATRLWQMTLDITCTMAHLPDAKTAQSVYMHRDTGLGYADLGAMLMAMGLPYDSDRGRAMASAVTALMHGACHQMSAQMARDLGAYPRFVANQKHHIRCVRNHIRALTDDTLANKRLHQDASSSDPSRYAFEGLTTPSARLNEAHLSSAIGDARMRSMMDAIRGVWNSAMDIGKSRGFRNAEMTVIAPTGTISIVMDCDTTGVEPMLGLMVSKTLAGGGKMVLKPAKCVAMGLQTLTVKYGSTNHGLADGEHIKQVMEFIEQHRTIPTGNSVDKLKLGNANQLAISDLHEDVFETSFPDPVTGKSIAWEAHVKMMAAVQTFISGAISKTVNMPYDATVMDIKKAYRMAHDLGVKAVAVYRDGCKLSQPLNVPGLASGDEYTEAEVSVIAKTQDIGHRLKALVIEATTVGLSSPLQSNMRVRLPNVRNPGIDVAADIGGGTLYVRTTRYHDGKLGEIWMTYSADQGLFQAMLGQVCKLANIALQFGVPPEAVLKTMMKTQFEPRGMVGGHKYIKTAPSLLNLGARLIFYHEFGDTSHLNISPKANLSAEDEAAVTEVMKEGILSGDNAISLATESCPQCGSNQYVTSGAGCKKCSQCGFSGGCG